MNAYYNDNEPYICQWLRNLIAAGLIARGDVDGRSILELRPGDLRGYAQCHFFAGIGGWSYALRLAGWADDRPVWTGSCPCQPFSAAGAQRGSDDERHLWPALFRLIRECRPATVIGEQVAGAAGLAWLDHVCADLESAGYAAAAADLPAACIGAPHIRQRLWWVANAERRPAERQRLDVATETRGTEGEARQRQRIRDDTWTGVATVMLAQSERAERGSWRPVGFRAYGAGPHAKPAGSGANDFGGDAEREGLEGHRADQAEGGRIGAARPVAAAGWSDLVWLPCSDGKARPTQPGLLPLAHGVSARVGRLRAYGNAIVPQVAAAFIESVMECIP